ncbi:unnamed protein product [Adineta ricciae]|uniref:Tlde1 domain-containing protein n=1 Tax=Adineta ricciae TaxID=249248 RepID=A0A816G0C5_ADIRI|nr:unnamed protein product [Adineta ricciae]
MVLDFGVGCSSSSSGGSGGLFGGSSGGGSGGLFGGSSGGGSGGLFGGSSGGGSGGLFGGSSGGSSGGLFGGSSGGGSGGLFGGSSGGSSGGLFGGSSGGLFGGSSGGSSGGLFGGSSGGLFGGSSGGSSGGLFGVTSSGSDVSSSVSFASAGNRQTSGSEYTYSQSKEQFCTKDKDVCKPSYSGYKGETDEKKVDKGPIPKGTYTIDNSCSKQGERCNLIPDANNKMHGRSNFQIHGDNKHGNRSASHGCIILNTADRKNLKKGDKVVVIE